MKKYIPIIAAMLFAGSVCAQTETECRQGRHKEPPKIEEMVSNLSNTQKKKLDNITADSKKQIDQKRAQLQEVRKLIRTVMETEGDQSAKLFPLFDREAQIKASIAKSMYTTRVQIDKVLTKEQIAEFRAKRDAERKKHQKAMVETDQDDSAPAEKVVKRKTLKTVNRK